MKNTKEKNKIIPLQTIGKINSNEQNFIFSIQVDESVRSALKELNQFSHVIVYWWGDKITDDEKRTSLVTSLPYAKGKKVGVFACRSPYRPNPILSSVCEIINIDENEGTIKIDYIDALDESILIDLKPYIPASDRIKNVRVAEWLTDWPEWREDAGEFFADKGPEFFGME